MGLTMVSMSPVATVLRFISTTVAFLVSFIGDLFILVAPQILALALMKPEEAQSFDERELGFTAGDEFYSEETKPEKGLPFRLPSLNLRKSEREDPPVSLEGLNPPVGDELQSKDANIGGGEVAVASRHKGGDYPVLGVYRKNQAKGKIVYYKKVLGTRNDRTITEPITRGEFISLISQGVQTLPTMEV